MFLTSRSSAHDSDTFIGKDVQALAANERGKTVNPEQLRTLGSRVKPRRADEKWAVPKWALPLFC